MRLCRQTNAELEASANIFRMHGAAYRAEVERIEELLDRRREMGYDSPEPTETDKEEMERDRQRKIHMDILEKLKPAAAEGEEDGKVQQVHEQERTERGRAQSRDADDRGLAPIKPADFGALRGERDAGEALSHPPKASRRHRQR